MRSIWRLAVIGAFLLAGSAGTKAQSSATMTLNQQGTPTMQQKTTAPAPLSSVLGLPVGVDAPVAAPYRGGFQDFGGQPETGREAATGLND